MVFTDNWQSGTFDPCKRIAEIMASIIKARFAFVFTHRSPLRNCPISGELFWEAKKEVREEPQNERLH